MKVLERIPHRHFLRGECDRVIGECDRVIAVLDDISDPTNSPVRLR